MSNQSKKEYLAKVRERYKNCKTRKEKSILISEIETNLKVLRKSAIRLLRQKVLAKRKTIKSRKKIYGYDLIKPLKQIWETVGYPCSKRLKPQIKQTIEKLKEFNMRLGSIKIKKSFWKK
jgi:thymidylate synthase